MKRLIKIDSLPEGVGFDWNFTDGESRRVQGGTMYSPQKGYLYVESGGRYKLYSDGVDYVKFLEGAGHFKWARGEISFAEGDIFFAQETGEYEINGVCRFAVVRK